MVDVGSRCPLVVMFETAPTKDDKCGNTTPAELRKAFCERWLQDRPRPHAVRYDPEGCFSSKDFTEMTHSLDIHREEVAGEASWKKGVVEGTIKILKNTATKIALAMPEISAEEAFGEAVHAHSSHYRHHGYSPHMLLFGHEHDL